MNNKGFWPEKVAIVDAIKEVLSIGRCTSRLPVHDYGRYRGGGWRNQNNDLVPYQSVDWYVYDALDEDRMQVDSRHILRAFAVEPWRNEGSLGDHYDLLLMEEDMFDPDEPPARGAGYAVGRSERLTAAVISTHRIGHIWGLPYSYLKTEVMRQLCFMFGVPQVPRGDVTLQDERLYCANTCILRPAHVAPDDWELLSADRLKHGALCESCTEDLRRFFREMAGE